MFYAFLSTCNNGYESYSSKQAEKENLRMIEIITTNLSYYERHVTINTI